MISQIDNKTGALNERLEQISQRSVWERLTDRFYGYDYFISYRWSDGRFYAVSLCEQLQDKGFDCFLDSTDFGAGVNWKSVGDQSIRKTSRLILVGSPEVHASKAVSRELRVYRSTGKTIVPINIGESLTDIPVSSPLLEYLDRDSIWIPEPISALDEGPSPPTITKLVSSFDLERNHARRMRFLRTTGIVGGFLLLLAAGAILRLWWNMPGKRTAEALGRLRASGLTIHRNTDDPYSGQFEIAIREPPAQSTSILQDLTTLETYNDVFSLDTNMSLIGDLAPFKPLVNLKELHVAGSDLQSLSELSGMRQLTTLVVAQNRQLQDNDFLVLTELQQLRSLEIDGCSEVSNQVLGYLAGLPLQRLWINSCRKIDIEGVELLANLPLTELRMKNTSVIINARLIQLVDELPSLRTLAVSPQDADPDALQMLKTHFKDQGYRLDVAKTRTDF